jgi:hypothetical protein
VKQLWKKPSTGAVLDQTDYTYDYAGNRIWREDVGAAAQRQNYDYCYGYDGLHRPDDAQRGNLTGTPYSGVASKNFHQSWYVDPLGNWHRFLQNDNGDSTWELDHERGHNAANELVEFDTFNGPDWVDPVHDGAGNMTELPSPLAPSSVLHAKYDAWNRLVEVKTASRSLVLQNEYDGQLIISSGARVRAV